MNRIYIFGIDSVRGGIELMMNYLINDLSSKKEKKVTIVTCYEKIAFQNEYIKQGVEIEIIPSKKHIFKYKKSLKRLIENLDSNDILYVNLSSYCNWPLLSELKKAGCQVVIHGHNAHTANIIKKVIHRAGKKIYKNLGYKIAVSEQCNNFMFMGKADLVLYNGIESGKFLFNKINREKIRKDLGYSDNELIVGCVGRISKEKNQLYLVKKANLYPKIVFLFIGGFVDSKYEKRIKSAASKNCVFMGQKENVHELLSTLDAIIIPSLHEAFPLVAIESFTNGLSVFLNPVLYEQQIDLFLNENCFSLTESNFNIDKIQSLHNKRNSSLNESFGNYDIKKWLETINKIIS